MLKLAPARHRKRRLKNYVVRRNGDIGRIQPDASVSWLAPFDNCNGYDLVKIEGVNKKVHQIVLESFLRPPRKGENPNHKNGNRKDNRLANLEWTDDPSNRRHSMFVLNKGKHISDAKARKVFRDYHKGVPVKKLAEREGISTRLVYYFLSGQVRPHIKAEMEARA